MNTTKKSEDRFGALIETVAHVMKMVGQVSGRYVMGKAMTDGEWMDLPYAFDQAVQGANTIFEHLRPPGEIVVPDTLPPGEKIYLIAEGDKITITHTEPRPNATDAEITRAREQAIKEMYERCGFK